MNETKAEVPRELWFQLRDWVGERRFAAVGQRWMALDAVLNKMAELEALAATKPGEGYWLAKDDPFWKAVDALVADAKPHVILPRIDPEASVREKRRNELLDAVNAADPRRESVEKLLHAGPADACPRCEPSPAPTVSAEDIKAVLRYWDGTPDLVDRETRRRAHAGIRAVALDYASRHGLRVGGEK